MQNNTQIDQIQQFMKKIGIAEIETQLYLKLLETGPISMSELAKKMGVARTTAFENIQKLIEKGLITRTVKGKRILLVAEAPNKVKVIIDAREIELASKQKELDVIKDDLPVIVNSFYNLIPKVDQHTTVNIKYYEGKKNVKLVYEQMSKADEAYSFANVDKYYEVFTGKDNILWDALDKNFTRKVWDILVDSPFARKNAKGHDRYFCKFLPPSESFLGFDILIYEDNVAIVQLEINHELATVIQSKHLASSLKGLHSAIWNLLPNN